MPEQAAQKRDVAPDTARDKTAAPAAGGDGALATAAIPAMVRPGLGFGGGRIPPPTLIALQRRAGNRAVSSLIAQRVAVPMIRRPDEELIAEAIKDRDVAKIKRVANLSKAKFEDKISMIDILTDQGWVGPNDESALEVLWGSFGDGVLDVASKNAGLWEKSLKGGAELYKLPTVKPIADKFLSDTRAIAGGFLDTNEKYTVTELGKLGVMEGGAAAPPEAEQAARQAELTAAIRIAKETQDAQAQLRQVNVSLERRYNMMSDSQLYFPGRFDPQHPPDPADENPDPSRIEKARAKGLSEEMLARTPWKNVKAQWDVLEAILQGLAIAYPTVGIALTATPQAMGTAGGDDPKAAKAQIVTMLTGARDAIRETRPKLAGKLAYELSPIHQQLFAGTKGASGIDWKDPVRQVVAKEVLELESNVEFWKTMGLATLAAAAFILAEFATAGLATAALVGFGVGLGAGQAIVAWEKALEMQTAEKATTGAGTELLASGQADMATFEAALATVMVFVDAFMAAKPLGRAITGAVDRAALAAGAKVASRIGEELAALAGKAPDRALAERAISELGAEAVISKTGKSATELLAIVGEESPVAARLKALSAIPADLAKLTVPELSKRARQLAVEIATNKETGEQVAALALERFGPRQLVEMNGGWKKISLALGNESATGKAIMVWRDSTMADIEAFVKTLPGGVDETGKAAVKRTGSQGKFTNDFDVSLLGPNASKNRDALRSFVGGRFGTSPDRLGELLLADFFTDPRRLHLYDQLDPLLRAELGNRAEKVAEATIFAKTLDDAEKAGNKELAQQIRNQMKELGVEEVPFKPLSEGDRSALYSKIDDYHQQLEAAIQSGDKAVQKSMVEKIGDTQGLINATEGGGYFSGGATRQIVTLAEGLLKGAEKPLDAQVYTTLLDQLPKLNAEASSLLKAGVVAGEDTVAAIKGIAKYGNRFKELMSKLEVVVADQQVWDDLAKKLSELLHQAKGEADVTLLARLESDAKAVEAEVNSNLATFRAESQKVLNALSRQAAIANQKVDLNAIQFMVMATAKLTRTSNAIRESLKLIVAQMVEAAAVAPKSDQNQAPANPAATPAPGGSGTSAPGGAKPADKGGQPAQRLALQRAAMPRRAAERRPERSPEHRIERSEMQRVRNFEAPAEARSGRDQPVQRRSAASYGGNLFLQRDPHGDVVTAINNKGTFTDRQGDFKTAWGVLNSLNMHDMLETMETLRVDGNLGKLMGHPDDAKKFNVARLMAAVHVVNLRASGKTGDPVELEKLAKELPSYADQVADVETFLRLPKGGLADPRSGVAPPDPSKMGDIKAALDPASAGAPGVAPLAWDGDGATPTAAKNRAALKKQVIAALTAHLNKAMPFMRKMQKAPKLPMTSFEGAGQEAKRMVDATFGATTGAAALTPGQSTGRAAFAFKGGTNLLDETDPKDYTPNPADIASWIAETDPKAFAAQKAHHFDKSRPAEGAFLTTEILTPFVAARTADLAVYDAYGFATASAESHTVWATPQLIGKTKSPAPGVPSPAERFAKWSMWETLVHEYIHVLEHPAFGVASKGRRVMKEGFCEYFTREVLLAQIPKAKGGDPAILTAVEGHDASGKPFPKFTPDLVPAYNAGAYADYQKGADKVAAATSPDAMRAAFFQGHVELIGLDDSGNVTAGVPVGSGELVTLPSGVTTPFALGVITGSSAAEIIAANPGLTAKGPLLNPTRVPGVRYHTVVSAKEFRPTGGVMAESVETADLIAEQNGVTKDALQRANPGIDFKKIAAGDRILIPKHA